MKSPYRAGRFPPTRVLKLSIRITDGCYRLVTHILRLPVGLAIEAREAWQQERRGAGLLAILPQGPNVRGPMLTSQP